MMQRVVKLGVVALLTVALIVGIWSRTADQEKTAAGPQQRPSSTATSTRPSPVSTTASSKTTLQRTLEQAVFDFEEAFNLPPSTDRDLKLRALSTPEGFASVARGSTEGSSLAEQNAGNISIRANRQSNYTVQTEEFDETDMSVYSKVEITILRENQQVQTLTITHISFWTNQSGTWKFIGFQT